VEIDKWIEESLELGERRYAGSPGSEDPGATN
jgi:hypothetical protein